MLGAKHEARPMAPLLHLFAGFGTATAWKIHAVCAELYMPLLTQAVSPAIPEGDEEE